MKKTLLILLLLIPFFGFSQTTKPIEGFLGIKFGSSKADVIAAMQAKGAELRSTNKTGNSLAFNKVVLGHRESINFLVQFTDDDKAYSAAFVFQADEEPKTIEYYNALIKDLDEIYGPGKQSRDFRTTFTDGDGYELTAIQTGNADYITIWKSDNTNSISLTISSKLRIFLFYRDGLLTKEVDAKEKAKEKGDY